MFQDCNRLNSINNCEMQLGGIDRIWIINFGDIHSFVYSPNNINKIVDYSLNYIPTEFRPLRNNDSFSFEYDNGEATRNPKIRLLKEDKKKLTHHIPIQFDK